MGFIKDISRSKGNNVRTWTTEIRIDDGERYLALNRNSKSEKRQFPLTEKNKFLKMLLHQFRDIRSVAREPNQKVRGYERNKSNLITMRGSPSIQTPKNPDKSGIRSEHAFWIFKLARFTRSVCCQRSCGIRIHDTTDSRVTGCGMEVAPMSATMILSLHGQVVD